MARVLVLCTLLASVVDSTAAETNPPPLPPAAATDHLQWEEKPGRLLIRQGAETLGEFVYSDGLTRRPHFHRLRAPGGAALTRNHPPVAGDAPDHAGIHTGLWLAFGNINGHDFWRNVARIEHVRFIRAPEVVHGTLQFTSESRLVTEQGHAVAEQRLTFTARLHGRNALWLTLDAELVPLDGELVFGAQEEMGLGIRVATPLTGIHGGEVWTSDGLRGAAKVWGKTAAWAAYTREIDGQLRGIALFPAARNPHATWWHARDYGLLVANGFGPRALPAELDGKFVVKRGSSLRLRYGVLLFDAPPAALEDFSALNTRYQASLERTAPPE